MDFIPYLENLTPEDWNKKVTDAWTVKDVIAHLVGWAKGNPEAIRNAWETKRPPWWLTTNDYKQFNQESVDYYRSYPPRALLKEWRKWQEETRREIARIGEANLRSCPDLFGWLFEGETERHYEHHYQQIKHALEREEL